MPTGALYEMVTLTKVVPVLLHVLDLQLVPALCEDGFGVLFKAPRQYPPLPGSSVDPPVHVHHHYDTDRCFFCVYFQMVSPSPTAIQIQ